MVNERLKTFYHNKHVLVTGGAGFIGSHLTEKLVALGAKVTVFDNFSTGNINNLAAVFSQITIACADIKTSFSAIKATEKKDLVFHLAAFISVAQSLQNPQLCKEINTIGTFNILEGCKKNNVPMLVFSSSSAIYGNQETPCSEECTPQPQSPYAQSKLEGEYACKKYAEIYGLGTACLRYFNVYGDRQNPEGSYAAVVAKFKHNIKHQLPITIFGNGNQSRDFIHVSEVVNANLLVGMCHHLRGEIFNIGTGTSINLFDLIAKLEDELNTKATDITFQPARNGDIYQSQANCEKYKKLFNEFNL